MPKDPLIPKDPHDRLFKRVMSDEANVRQFIKEFLPKELSSQIDLNDMKLIPTEKVRGYNKYYMDIAVECKIAVLKDSYISFLNTNHTLTREFFFKY